MVNDIIKNILIKFKGDSKDFEKSMKDIQKAGQGIEKSFSSQQSRKQLSDFAKNYSKVFGDASGSMEKIAKNIKSINEKEMKDLSNRANDLFQKTQKIQSQIDKTEDKARRSQLERRRDTLNRGFQTSAGQFNDLAKDVPDAKVGMMSTVGSQLSGMMGVPLTGVAMAAAVAKGFHMFANSPMNALRSGASMTSLADSMYSGGASGNFSRAFYLANNPNAQAQARKAAGVADSTDIFGMKVNLGPTDLKGFSKDLIRAARSFSGVFDGVGGVSREYQKLQAEDINESINNKQAMNIESSKYLPYLQSKANSRLSFQRAMNMGDAEMYANLTGANKAGMFEDEFFGTSMALRSSLGGNNARQVAIAAGRARSATGMDLNTSSGLMASMIQSGGTASGSENKLIEILSKGMSKGITDVNLAEMLVKANVESLAQSGQRGSAGYATLMSAQVLSQMGDQTDIRNVKAAAGINDTVNSVIGASDFNTQAKRIAISNFVNKNVKDPRMRRDATEFLVNMPDLGQMGSSETMRNVTGLTAEQLNPLGEQIKNQSLDLISGGKGRKARTQSEFVLQMQNTMGEENAKALWIKMQQDKFIGPPVADTVPSFLKTGERQSGALELGNLEQENIERDMASGVKTSNIKVGTDLAAVQTKTGLSSGMGGAIDDVTSALNRLKSVLESSSGFNQRAK